MSTERQSEESVDNEQTFEMENEDTIAAVPHFPSEPKDKEEFNEELTRVDTDPGSLEEGQSAEDDLEESIRLVPKIVRELVSMEDDPTLPTLTFRYVTILVVAFCLLSH